VQVFSKVLSNYIVGKDHTIALWYFKKLTTMALGPVPYAKVLAELHLKKIYISKNCLIDQY